MQINVGSPDRIARIAIGALLIGLALAGSSGKSGWSWKGAAAPNILFDWSDARQRFHAQWTPAGAVLKASRSW